MMQYCTRPACFCQLFATQASCFILYYTVLYCIDNSGRAGLPLASVCYATLGRAGLPLAGVCYATLGGAGLPLAGVC